MAPRQVLWSPGKKNHLGHYPLHLALLEKKHAFVDAVLSQHDLKNLASLLKHTCSKENCLHIAISKSSPSIELMINKCKKYPEIFTQENYDKNTPLHVAMSFMGDEVDPSRLEHVIRDLIPAATPAQQAAINGGLASNGVDSRRSSLSLSSLDEETESQGSDVDDESQAGDGDSQAGDLIPGLHIVELLVTACSDVLKNQNVENRTPYQERIYQLRNSPKVKQVLEKVKPKDAKGDVAASKEDAFRKIVVEDPIAEYIRAYCVREFSRDQIMECLYQPGQGTCYVVPRVSGQALTKSQNDTLSLIWQGCQIPPSHKPTSKDWRIISNSKAF